MTKKRAGSVIFLTAGLYGLFLSLRLPLGQWNEPGAGAFPLIVSLLLCLSGSLMFLAPGQGRIAVNLREIVKDQKTPLQIVLLTAAFIALLNTCGYLLTAALYTFALLFGVSRYRIWIAGGLALVLSVVSWYVFGQLLETPLPRGFLPF